MTSPEGFPAYNPKDYETGSQSAGPSNTQNNIRKSCDSDRSSGSIKKEPSGGFGDKDQE
jgi:hypothetical protein